MYVLFQKDYSEREHSIDYFSQKLAPAQKNYSVIEREWLTIALAIKKFRPYLELMPFTVTTENWQDV